MGERKPQNLTPEEAAARRAEIQEKRRAGQIARQKEDRMLEIEALRVRRPSLSVEQAEAILARWDNIDDAVRRRKRGGSPLFVEQGRAGRKWGKQLRGNSGENH